MAEDESPCVAFVHSIATGLCTNPEAIEIEEKVDERGVLVQLYVAKEDIGRVIGQGGETATAIRLLLRSLGSKNSARYSFKVDTRPYSVG